MKIGTDFSGIGSPEMALKLLGIEHEQVFIRHIIVELLTKNKQAYSILFQTE